jgi:hypothetical protein
MDLVVMGCVSLKFIIGMNIFGIESETLRFNFVWPNTSFWALYRFLYKLQQISSRSSF